MTILECCDCHIRVRFCDLTDEAQHYFECVDDALDCWKCGAQLYADRRPQPAPVGPFITAQLDAAAEQS